MPKPTTFNEVSFDEIAEHFHLPIVEASLKLGVCNSTIKRICTENGVLRWPYRKIMAGKTVEEIKREAILALHSQGEGGTGALSGGDMPAGGTAGDFTSALGDSNATTWGDGDVDFVAKRRRLDDSGLLLGPPSGAPLSAPISSPSSAAPHPMQDQRLRAHSGSSGQLAAWASHGAFPADAMRQPTGVTASPASAAGLPSSANRLRMQSSLVTAGTASQAPYHPQQQQLLHTANRLPLPPAFRTALQQPLLNPASFPLPFPLPLAKRVESAVRRGLRIRGRGDEDEGFPWEGLDWNANRWWGDDVAAVLGKEEGREEMAHVGLSSLEIPQGADSDGSGHQKGRMSSRSALTHDDKDLKHNEEGKALPLMSFGEEGDLSAVAASARLEAVLHAAAQRSSEGVQCGLAGGIRTLLTASPEEMAVLKFVLGPFIPRDWQ